MNLDELHEEIKRCRKCLAYSNKILKPKVMERGQVSKILVIGVNPGRQEIKTGRAFSGQAGRVLFDWLQKAGIGANEYDIRKKVYFTSIIKCKSPDETTFKFMVRNCVKFLIEQIRIINPELIVTLGEKPLRLFADNKLDFTSSVGNKFREKELNLTLFPLLNDQTIILPFPHPSPRSIWTHDGGNKKLLDQAIYQLSTLIREEA